MRQGIHVLLLTLTFGLSAFYCDGQIVFQQYPFGFTGLSGNRPQARLLSGPDGTLYGTTFLGGRYGRGTIFRIQEDGSGFQLLYDFKPTGGDGLGPYGDLVFGNDGSLYGTTQGGGTNNGAGTMFRIEADGTGYRILFHFYSNGGYGPRGHLQEGDDGAFYGTTQFGGLGGWGTVYKLNQDGSGFRVLHHLGTRFGDGRNSDTGLTLGSDGMLYGVASIEGLFDRGALFKIGQDGRGYTNLHHFQGPAAQDGMEPDGRPLELADGMLYGTTGGPGFSPPGTIYRINKDGTGYSVLRIFDTTSGEPGAVTSEVILGSDGALYSTSSDTVFKIHTNGSGLQVLHRFTQVDGFIGRGLVMGTNGGLFGTTSFGGGSGNDGTLFRINQDGSGFAVLFRFQDSTNNLQLPRASLIRGSDGLFYGTTEAGGGGTNAGSIFSFRTNSGGIRLVFAFGQGTNTARMPNGLLEASDGWLYGTTQSGAMINGGTVFKIARNGSNFAVLRQLGAVGDARTPRGALIEGMDGWLYGTSFSGGTNGRGTVFKIQKETGELTILRAFGPGTADGVNPHGDLVQATDGALYGTANIGGANGLGTIYRLHPDGSGFTNLHHFAGGIAGQNPQAGLMIGSDQKLYGTTARIVGGFAGVVFSVAMDGTGYQVLRAFPNTGSEPKSPRPVVEGLDGILYGITASGGMFNKGTLYRVNKDGSDFQILRHAGSSIPDGQLPSAALTVLGDGSFLGVTEAGGDGGNGTIYRFDPEAAVLGIAHSGAQAELSWNRSSTVDTVEATTDLSGNDWHPTGGPVAEQGDQYSAEVLLNAPGQFFRIRREWK